MEIPGSFGAKRPRLSLFKTDRVRDVLADYCESMWPVGRRKTIERLWGLSSDEARAVCEGSASQRTLDKVWRAGGWGLVLPVFTKLLGEGVDQHIARERARNAATASTLREVSRSLRALPAAHTAADRGVAPEPDGELAGRLGGRSSQGGRRPPVAASQGRGGEK